MKVNYLKEYWRYEKQKTHTQVSITMGSCTSKASLEHRRPARYYTRGRRVRSRSRSIMPEAPQSQQLSDPRGRMTGFSVSEIVHVETANHGKSEHSKTIHLTQMQWHHSQRDCKGKNSFEVISTKQKINQIFSYHCRLQQWRCLVWLCQHSWRWFWWWIQECKWR